MNPLGSHPLRHYGPSWRGLGIILLIIVLAVVAQRKYSAYDNVVHTRIATLCSEIRGQGTDNYRVKTASGGVYAAAHDHYLDMGVPGQTTLRGQTTLVLRGTYTIHYKHHRWAELGWYPEIVAAERLPADQQQTDTCPNT